MPPSHLLIRTGQMNALQEDMDKRWIEMYLRNCYGVQAEAMDPPALQSFVDCAFAKARKRNIIDPYAARKFIHVAFLMGIDFDQEPWAKKILTSRFYRQQHAQMRALEDTAIKLLKEKEEKA
jgi:hypothetical protein